MEDTNSDANIAEASSVSDNTGVGHDAAPTSPIMDDDGLVSTVEYQIPKTDTDPADTSEDAEQNTSGQDRPDDKKGFHQHERFRELVSEKNEAKQMVEALQKKISELESHVIPIRNDSASMSKKRFEYTPIKDIPSEELIEKFSENPHAIFEAFARNISDDLLNYLEANRAAEMQQHQQSMTQAQQHAEIRRFFDTRPDAQQLLASGKILEFMRTNPGHNAFSAYYELTGGGAPRTDPEAIRQQERERVARELKAKGFARSTSTGRAATNVNYDPAKSPELRNPDKYGGRNNVLLERLKARAAGGM